MALLEAPSADGLVTYFFLANGCNSVLTIGSKHAFSAFKQWPQMAADIIARCESVYNQAYKADENQADAAQMRGHLRELEKLVGCGTFATLNLTELAKINTRAWIKSMSRSKAT